MGHKPIICHNKNYLGEGAQIANQVENQLFVATCFLTSELSESWLIDSSCTNHMTSDKALFRDLRLINVTNIRIGNADFILVKGKGQLQSQVVQAQGLFFMFFSFVHVYCTKLPVIDSSIS